MKYLITKSTATQIAGAHEVRIAGKIGGDIIITLSGGAHKIIPGVMGTDQLNNKFIVEETRDGYALVYEQPSAAMLN